MGPPGMDGSPGDPGSAGGMVRFGSSAIPTYTFNLNATMQYIHSAVTIYLYVPVRLLPMFIFLFEKECVSEKGLH